MNRTAKVNGGLIKKPKVRHMEFIIFSPEKGKRVFGGIDFDSLQDEFLGK
ncbi:hypothetical protein HYV84_07040 [Candidatus Woesearchaeota archaeon]|nr:hypothetical protein [Candidatus Woesearchaeota archaeon]